MLDSQVMAEILPFTPRRPRPPRTCGLTADPEPVPMHIFAEGAILGDPCECGLRTFGGGADHLRLLLDEDVNHGQR